MFEEASNRITAWLSKIKIISSDQEVVCKWGMTHILDTLFNIATFTAIGLLFECFRKQLYLQSHIFRCGHSQVAIMQKHHFDAGLFPIFF